MAPQRKFGMTRPWFLIVLVLAVVATVFAMVASGGFLAWLAWSLGGVAVGAGFLTFDASRDG